MKTMTVEIPVPNGARWVAVNPEGYLTFFTHKPVLDVFGTCWVTQERYRGKARQWCVCKVVYEGNWRESLRRVA